MGVITSLNKIECIMVINECIEKLRVYVKFWLKKQNENFHCLNNQTIPIEVLRIPPIK